MAEEAAGHGGGHSVVVSLTSGRRKRIPVGHAGPISVKTLRDLIAEALEEEEEGAEENYEGLMVDPGRVRLKVDGIEPDLHFVLSEKDRRERVFQVDISENGIQDEINEAEDDRIHEVRNVLVTNFGADVEQDLSYHDIIRKAKALMRPMGLRGPSRGRGDDSVLNELLTFLKEVIPDCATLKEVSEHMKEEFFQ